MSSATESSIPSVRWRPQAGRLSSNNPGRKPIEPVQDLIGKTHRSRRLVDCGNRVAAWLFGKFYRRQTEAARRIEREVIFNEKILANMPSGIALVDPRVATISCRRTKRFAQMAQRFGQLPEEPGYL